MKDSAYTSRRDFLRRTAATAAASGPLALAQTSKGKTVALIVDPTDSAANAAPARWATDELAKALTAKGIGVRRAERPNQATGSDFVILASTRSAPLAPAILKAAAVELTDSPDSLALVPTRISDQPGVLASSSDTRGLVYALLELADRVNHAP